MLKKCIICGKQFEPYKPMANRQKCCSRECSKVYGRQYNKEHYDYNSNHERYRQRMKNRKPVMCRICGKPIERALDARGYVRSQRWMHQECVFNDIMMTIAKGEEVSTAQRQRLSANGYTLKEFKQEFKKEILVI